MPSQLALHLWPASAFVYGIRVDYLSPAIYFTDILLIALFSIWITNDFKTFKGYLFKYKFWILLALIFILFNIIQSSFFAPTIFRWVKLVEIFLFAFYFSKRGAILSSNIIYKALLLSTLFVSLIGIAQFVVGHTIGGPLYLLGERSFNISTPGIALSNIFGRVVLRSYSTFPHPNVFAGYLSVMLILLTTWYFKINKPEKYWLLIPFVALVLTFSFSAVICLLGICIYVLIHVKNKFDAKKSGILLSALFVVSIISPLFFGLNIFNNFKFPNNLSERITLSKIAGSLSTKRPLLGNGLNTFIVKETEGDSNLISSWLLQPVHNIYLLVFSEMGIVGLVFLFCILFKIMRSPVRHESFKLALVYILLTGLFDHYWLTLQQTNILLAFVAGKILSERN